MRYFSSTLIALTLVSVAVFSKNPVVYPSEKYPDYPFSEAVSYNGVLYLSGDLGAGCPRRN